MALAYLSFSMYHMNGHYNYISFINNYKNYYKKSSFKVFDVQSLNSFNYDSNKNKLLYYYVKNNLEHFNSGWKWYLNINNKYFFDKVLSFRSLSNVIYVGTYGILAEKKALNSILFLCNALKSGSKVLFVANADTEDGLSLIKLNYLNLNNTPYFPYKDVRFYYHRNIHKIIRVFDKTRFDIVVVYPDNAAKLQNYIFQQVAHVSFGISDLYARPEIFDYYIPGNWNVLDLSNFIILSLYSSAIKKI